MSYEIPLGRNGTFNKRKKKQESPAAGEVLKSIIAMDIKKIIIKETRE